MNDYDELVARVNELEKRVVALETTDDTPADALTDGVVGFSGDVTTPQGPVQYSWQRPASFLSENAWEPSFQRIAALSSPIRGQILRRLWEAPASVAELVDEGVFSSTGKAYHHLNELLHAGWIEKDSHGKHRIPPARVVPLLAIVAAAEDH